MIRVVLPAHLRTLARVDGEVELEVEGPVTQRSVLDALEARYPMLRGTIRDHVTQQRRPFLRFFACEEDLSHEPPDAPLPDAVVTGRTEGQEPVVVASARNLMHLTIAPDDLRSMRRSLRVGERVDSDDLLHWAARMGYQRTPLVFEPGTIAQRGGVIDLFPARLRSARPDRPVRR